MSWNDVKDAIVWYQDGVSTWGGTGGNVSTADAAFQTLIQENLETVYNSSPSLQLLLDIYLNILGNKINIAQTDTDNPAYTVDIYQTSGFISDYAISISNGIITVTDINTEDGIDEGTDTLVNMEKISLLGEDDPILFTDLLSGSGSMAMQKISTSLPEPQYDDGEVFVQHHVVPIASIPPAYVHDYIM